jgi:hypothetical protein
LGNPHGIATAYLFDPVKFEASPTDSGWAQTAPMQYQRYYPTATVLPDGRVIAISGQIQGPLYATTHEIYDPKYGAPWSTSATNSNMRYYPFVHVLPGKSTRLLYSGPTLPENGTRMEILNLDVQSPSWQLSAVVTIAGGATSMYDKGRLFKTGGLVGSPSQVTSQTEIVSTASDGTVSPSTVGATMGNPRLNHNLVALPDGKIVAIGGNISNETNTVTMGVAVWRTEIFTPPVNPATSPGEWCTVSWMLHHFPDSPIPRMYHSTALLLPDGKVLVAGGETSDVGGCPQPPGAGIPPQVQCVSADFYKPPYLFKADNTEIGDADRPQLITWPTLMGTGTSYLISANPGGPAGTSITRASLIRPSSTTHAYDSEQREIPLNLLPGGGGNYVVDAPRSPYDAPPGYYMFFLMNNADGAGHPSIAKFVRLWSVQQSTIVHSSLEIAAEDGDDFDITLSWETQEATQGQRSKARTGGWTGDRSLADDRVGRQLRSWSGWSSYSDWPRSRDGACLRPGWIGERERAVRSEDI